MSCGFWKTLGDVTWSALGAESKLHRAYSLTPPRGRTSSALVIGAQHGYWVISTRHQIMHRINRRHILEGAIRGRMHTEVCWKERLTYDIVARNVYVLIYIQISFQIPLLQVPYSCKSLAWPHLGGFWSSAPHLCHSSLQQSPMRIGKKQKARCTAAQMSGARCNKGKQLSLDLTNMCELAWLFVIPFLAACSHSSAEFKHSIFQLEVSFFFMWYWIRTPRH